MTPLERKKIEVELLRVNAAKEEMNLKVLEFQEQILKYEGFIAIQESKELELKEKLK